MKLSRHFNLFMAASLGCLCLSAEAATGEPTKVVYTQVQEGRPFPVADNEVMFIPCAPINSDCKVISESFASTLTSKTKAWTDEQLSTFLKETRNKLSSRKGFHLTRTNGSGTALINCPTLNCLVHSSISNNGNSIIWSNLLAAGKTHDLLPSKGVRLSTALPIKSEIKPFSRRYYLIGAAAIATIANPVLLAAILLLLVLERKKLRKFSETLHSVATVQSEAVLAAPQGGKEGSSPEGTELNQSKAEKDNLENGKLESNTPEAKKSVAAAIEPASEVTESINPHPLLQPISPIDQQAIGLPHRPLPSLTDQLPPPQASDRATPPPPAPPAPEPAPVPGPIETIVPPPPPIPQAPIEEAGTAQAAIGHPSTGLLHRRHPSQASNHPAAQPPAASSSGDVPLSAAQTQGPVEETGSVHAPIDPPEIGLLHRRPLPLTASTLPAVQPPTAPPSGDVLLPPAQPPAPIQTSNQDPWQDLQGDSSSSDVPSYLPRGPERRKGERRKGSQEKPE